MKLKATSFATRQDLARFAAAVTHGHSVKEALNVGDNGIGAWGDATWIPNPGKNIVALPAGLGERGTRCKVTLRGNTIECVCLDRSPQGVCDLAPSALLALGLHPDTDIAEECEVSFGE